jgi:hypothetical protein
MDALYTVAFDHGQDLLGTADDVIDAWQAGRSPVHVSRVIGECDCPRCRATRGANSEQEVPE